MVRINALSPNPKVKIFAKLEGFNPTGSIKDRIAVKMIETAEREGRLTKGKTIIEPTSGNTGIGLAIVGIVKGYPVEIVMSEAVSIERRKIIRAYGGTVRLTPAAEGTDGAIRLARKLVAENPDKYFMPDQFANAANYLAHYENTALEIWQQTGGQIDYLVCAIGTSGTLMGLSRFLKVMNPAIKVVCAQPTKGHYIQGLKNMEEAIVPDIYDPSKIDVQELVESEGGDRHGPQDHLRRGYLRRDEQRRRHAGRRTHRGAYRVGGISSSYFPTVPKSTSARRCSGSSRIEARQGAGLGPVDSDSGSCWRTFGLCWMLRNEKKK